MGERRDSHTREAQHVRVRLKAARGSSKASMFIRPPSPPRVCFGSWFAGGFRQVSWLPGRREWLCETMSAPPPSSPFLSPLLLAPFHTHDLDVRARVSFAETIYSFGVWVWGVGEPC